MITLIIPYYRAPEMLKTQLERTAHYPADLSILVVDDGSPEPALDVFNDLDQDTRNWHIKKRTRLFRHLEDIPWNREQARNLGAYMANTEWLIQVDIDHVLPWECAIQLCQDLEEITNPSDWYQFPRKRIGKADFTRQKDQLDPDATEGWIKPHVDSYLITRDRYLKSPYDERYSGMLGGGTPFTARQNREHGQRKLLPDGIWLEVHTTDSVKDASITTLSRDKSAYSELRTIIGVNDKPQQILTRSPWEQVVWV